MQFVPTLYIDCCIDIVREDRNIRGGRGAERRPSPLPSKHREKPHRPTNRSRSPQIRRHQREGLSPRHRRRRARSLEKKDANVPSEEDELERLAVEVDKELDKRGIVQPMMTAVDISSSDETSSDDVDVSEEEAAKVEDSHGNNTEDGELADSDEDTSVSESEDDEDEEGSPTRGPVIKSRMLRKAISGYGEGESDDSSSSPPIEGTSRQPSVTPPAVMQESTAEEKSATETPAEEVKKEEPTKNLPTIDPDLPPYYPALYGCRSVEQYEWLNRIEEGTYGVVYRARDKRTGKSI